MSRTKLNASQIQFATLVSGIVNEHIKADAGIEQSKIAGLVAALAALSNADTTEAGRAVAAELVLSDGLAAEILRATDAEALRYTKTEVDAKFSAIIDNAPEVYNTLGKIAAALADDDTAAAAIVQSLADEVVRAKAAEKVNADAIIAETLRATAAELARYTKDEVDAKFSAIVDNAPEVFNTLGKIAAELANDDNAAAAIVQSIADEVIRATAAEQANTDAITAETQRATLAETANTTALNQAVQTLTNKDTDLQAQITAIQNGTAGVITEDRYVLRDAFSGVCDGVNTVFVLSKACVPGKETVKHCGAEIYPVDDYNLGTDNRTVTLTFAPAETDRMSFDFIAAV